MQQYVTVAFAMRVSGGALTKIATPHLIQRLEEASAQHTPQELARVILFTELGLESCVSGYPDPESVSDCFRGLLAQSASAGSQSMAFIQNTLPDIERAREFCLSVR